MEKSIFKVRRNHMMELDSDIQKYMRRILNAEYNGKKHTQHHRFATNESVGSNTEREGIIRNTNFNGKYRTMYDIIRISFVRTFVFKILLVCLFHSKQKCSKNKVKSI